MDIKQHVNCTKVESCLWMFKSPPKADSQAYLLRVELNKATQWWDYHNSSNAVECVINKSEISKLNLFC